MHLFKLEVVRCPDHSEDYHAVDISIDGIKLIDLLKKVEAPYAAAEGHAEIAGGYCSLPVKTTFFPSRHFLGEPSPSMRYKDKTSILICECGCEGCWDFVCKITLNDKTVTWSDFQQIHRTKWDYSALEAFEFERTQYENELRFPATTG